MTILVETPSGKVFERDYAVKVVLEDFLGLRYQLLTADRTDISITVQGSEGEIRFPDVFFSQPDETWLGEKSLPLEPLGLWDSSELEVPIKLTERFLPIIFGDSTPKADRRKHLPLDVFGAAFFMLSRYEEAVLSVRDVHDRFPATASLAYRSGFLDRPVVDEYIEVLWTAMKLVWPGLKRRQSLTPIKVSCDVDQPYMKHVKSIGMTLRNMAGDIIKRRSVSTAAHTALNTLCSVLGYYKFDMMNTFDWIMDVNEEVGNKVAFYFFGDHSVPEMGGDYSIEEPRVRALLKRIHERGHEIGLHGNYISYLDGVQYEKEADNLRQTMKKEGIGQTALGNRMHYLRWHSLRTARNLERANIDYDTTLGYADHPGFRCGTSRSYPMYDLSERRPLRLRQYPLTVMECSVLDAGYLGMGCTEAAFNLMNSLKQRAQQMGGTFALLWHNSRLETEEARSVYKQLIN